MVHPMSESPHLGPTMIVPLGVPPPPVPLQATAPVQQRHRDPRRQEEVQDLRKFSSDFKLTPEMPGGMQGSMTDGALNASKPPSGHQDRDGQHKNEQKGRGSPDQHPPKQHSPQDHKVGLPNASF